MIKCQICGNEYNYCPHCRDIASWKAIADKHECYQIAMILTEYREGILDAKTATECFSHINITADSDLSRLLPAVERDIKKIIEKGTEKHEIKTRKKKVNDVDIE